ncbi:MAG: type IV secretory system conjugative DNA transfer family protein [Henriciella sp.]|nr:type IV secretory system conjugative DNA transfer family protein [Henriciella sp.]
MPRQKPNLFAQAFLLGGFTYASLWLQPYQYHPDYLLFIWFIWGLTGLLALSFIFNLLGTLPNIVRQLISKKTKGLKGTAAWITKTAARKAKLFKRKGYLAGKLLGEAVWVTIESCGLVLAPAGSGKTRDFVIPALFADRGNMIVADLKGTLAAITARIRRCKFKQKTFFLNPANRFRKFLGKSARFNPLQLLNENWTNESRRMFLMSDARMLALQLLQEPKDPGQNEFFRKGSRKLLVFAFVYLAVTTSKATLSAALNLLSDMNQLTNALYKSASDDRLNGELIRMANDLLGKIQDGRQEQLESFREGALQVLEPYSASGVLADATSSSDFKFSDLRKIKGTVYIICDPTQMAAFAGWLGLVMESAKTELIREANGKPVTFMIDEATNFKFASLPALLTSAREFNMRLWVIVQELEQWAHVYGREALDTLMSQTEVKIIHGSRSFKTCQLISNMLGEYSVQQTNYNKGKSIFDPVNRNVSEVGRKLLTPDEVQKFKKAIVFVRDLPPMALQRIGYHQIFPWVLWADPNPLFGKGRYWGWPKLWL